MLRKHWVNMTMLTTMLVGVNAFAADMKISEVASDLKHPWGIAFLPSGDAIVSERSGGLRIVEQDGDVSEPLSGLPTPAVVGQGGMLGVAVHPNYAQNNLIYVCLSVDGEGGRGSEVHSAVLKNGQLQNVKPVFIQQPKVDSAHHFGCRITFDNDNMLYISLGDRGSKKENSQSTDDHIGTVVRLHDDGRIPQDNPFLAGAAPEVYTYGHRNVQGMVKHPQTGQIWTHEHGPKGGDEINILNKGNNYGWPSITYGVNYNGTEITDKTSLPSMQQPLKYWVPSIAPSGMTFYSGKQFTDWQGDLLVGSLKFRYLNRIEIENGKVVAEHKLLADLDQRIRDVVEGPDGSVYVLTDSPKGKVLKLSMKPKN